VAAGRFHPSAVTEESASTGASADGSVFFRRARSRHPGTGLRTAADQRAYRGKYSDECRDQPGFHTSRNITHLADRRISESTGFDASIPHPAWDGEQDFSDRGPERTTSSANNRESDSDGASTGHLEPDPSDQRPNGAGSF